MRIVVKALSVLFFLGIIRREGEEQECHKSVRCTTDGRRDGRRGREKGCLRPCSSAAARARERERERERDRERDRGERERERERERPPESQRPDTYDGSKDSLYDTPFTKLQPVRWRCAGETAKWKWPTRRYISPARRRFFFSLSPSRPLPVVIQAVPSARGWVEDGF